MFEKSSKFSKSAPSAPLLALRARKSENPAIEPPSGRNPAIEPPPPQGVRDPIISSAWTPKRARTGSRASLTSSTKNIQYLPEFSDFYPYLNNLPYSIIIVEK